ncbi:MAG TPA: Holliday junction branch migration protein RuvA [Candidatus Avibacteroides excrementipullorum]|jgi:Holliday junction DNA helicase RuvA|nr:Holliday junction branch migration protein RuvA [Candidatus Avibacteroides excrementipullorum]
MIEYLRGEIVEITPAYVVMDCAGVGYYANISLNTYTALQHAVSGKIFIYEAIREDAHVLFGFSSKEERDLFLLLISVSGIGGNTARMILSAFSVQELRNVISSGDAVQLKNVKGIGLKTAQRIIVDLKDKIGIPAGAEPLVAGQPSGETREEAVSALVILGFAANVSAKVVSSVLKENPGLTVEQIIKESLKRL